MQSPGCWIWTAAKTKAGYGVQRWDGRQQGAHRVVFQALVGSIPEGLELDHLCRVKSCVNPDHLDPVTRRVNLLRGAGPKIWSVRLGGATHCKRGHTFNEENTYFKPDGNRGCKACRKAASARHEKNRPKRDQREYLREYRRKKKGLN